MDNNQQANDLPVFMVTEGTLRGHQWIMYDDEIVVGRGGHCEIMIPERKISREHARIFRENGQFFIEDLKSKNGTFLNGEKIEGVHAIKEGDELQIALAVKLRFITQEATVPLEIDDFDSTAPNRRRGLAIDKRTRQVTINSELLDPQLSLYQYRLIELLHDRNGAVCTRDDIVEAVWPDADEIGVSEQAIDALVRRLRDRLAEADPDHQYVVTVRGHGFRLEQPD